MFIKVTVKKGLDETRYALVRVDKIKYVVDMEVGSRIALEDDNDRFMDVLDSVPEIQGKIWQEEDRW